MKRLDGGQAAEQVPFDLCLLISPLAPCSPLRCSVSSSTWHLYSIILCFVLHVDPGLFTHSSDNETLAHLTLVSQRKFRRDIAYFIIHIHTLVFHQHYYIQCETVSKQTQPPTGKQTTTSGQVLSLMSTLIQNNPDLTQEKSKSLRIYLHNPTSTSMSAAY